MSDYERQMISKFLQMYSLRYPLEQGADKPTRITSEDTEKNTYLKAT
jgi:hypothetical protein